LRRGRCALQEQIALGRAILRYSNDCETKVPGITGHASFG